MMIEGPNGDVPKTFKEKISEPILNVKQIVAIMFTLLYEVVTNLLFYFLMEEPNWGLILVNIKTENTYKV